MNKKGAVVIGATILSIAVMTISLIFVMTFVLFSQTADAESIEDLNVVSEGITYTENTMQMLLNYETGGETVREMLKNKPVDAAAKTTIETTLDSLVSGSYMIEINKNSQITTIGTVDIVKAYTSEEEIYAGSGKKIKLTLRVIP